MDRKSPQILIVTLLVTVTCAVVGCDKRSGLERLSPKNVIRSYYDAKDKGDIEFLRQIIIFPEDATEEQINSRIQSEMTGSGEKILTKAVGARIKVEYEKIIDDQMSEVGVIMKMGVPGFKKRIPFQQIVLKKEDSIWKYSHSKYDLTKDQLVATITKDPYDASAIFHLGRLYQPENPAKANKYYEKYRELEPQGFWVSEELLDQMKGYEDIENKESKLLGKLKNTPEKSSRRVLIYLTLGQLFTEHGDYKKTETYLGQAEKVMRSSTSKDSVIEKRLKTSQETFELAVKGDDQDILSKLEAKGVYK